MLQEDLCVLILSSVTRIGIHDQLSLWQVLREEERIDGCHDNIFIAVNDERRCVISFSVA